jgi:hypothetical protein
VARRMVDITAVVAVRQFLQRRALRAPPGGLFLLKEGGPCAFLGPWRGSCLPLSGCG